MCEKPVWKTYILHDSGYMTVKKQNYGDGKKISGWQVFGELRGEEDWISEIEGIF